MLRLTARSRSFPDRTRRLAMNRRKLLKAAGAAVASTTVAAPAIAQSAPALRWRLATSFPKSLDTLYGACEMFAKAMGELSDQKFQIGVDRKSTRLNSSHTVISYA